MDLDEILEGIQNNIDHINFMKYEAENMPYNVMWQLIRLFQAQSRERNDWKSYTHGVVSTCIKRVGKSPEVYDKEFEDTVFNYLAPKIFGLDYTVAEDNYVTYYIKNQE